MRIILMNIDIALSDKQQYVSVVCCGYIKLWTPSRSSPANNMADNDSNSADDSDLREY